jgi:hypothetical protein
MPSRGGRDPESKSDELARMINDRPFASGRRAGPPIPSIRQQSGGVPWNHASLGDRGTLPLPFVVPSVVAGDPLRGVAARPGLRLSGDGGVQSIPRRRGREDDAPRRRRSRRLAVGAANGLFHARHGSGRVAQRVPGGVRRPRTRGRGRGSEGNRGLESFPMSPVHSKSKSRLTHAPDVPPKEGPRCLAIAPVRDGS